MTYLYELPLWIYLMLQSRTSIYFASLQMPSFNIKIQNIYILYLFRVINTPPFLVTPSSRIFGQKRSFLPLPLTFFQLIIKLPILWRGWVVNWEKGNFFWFISLSLFLCLRVFTPQKPDVYYSLGNKSGRKLCSKC